MPIRCGNGMTIPSDVFIYHFFLMNESIKNPITNIDTTKLMMSPKNENIDPPAARAIDGQKINIAELQIISSCMLSPPLLSTLISRYTDNQLILAMPRNHVDSLQYIAALPHRMLQNPYTPKPGNVVLPI